MTVQPYNHNHKTRTDKPDQLTVECVSRQPNPGPVLSRTHGRALHPFAIMGTIPSQSELSTEVSTDTWDTNPAVLDADMYIPRSAFAALGVVPEPGRKYELHFCRSFNAVVHPVLLRPASRETGCVSVRIEKGPQVKLLQGGDVDAVACVVQRVLTREEVDAMVGAPSLEIVDASGKTRWFAHGLLHREDGPAVSSAKHQHLLYYNQGRLHRAGGLPAVVRPGQRLFYVEGALHRDDDEPAVVTSTTREWYQHGQRHRGLGLPAVIVGDGTREDVPGVVQYWEHGKLHRVDGPATTLQEGSDPLDGGVGLGPILPAWYFEGKLHREGGPAYKDTYYRHGVIHRDDGPAVVTGERMEWFRDGKRHRDDGPAVVDSGLEEWYAHGVLHRPDGPARTRSDRCDGSSEEWFLNGKLHRMGGPARSFPMFWEHYQDGTLHHDDPEVPAQVHREPTTGILFRAFYVRGVLQKKDTDPADARYVAPNGDQTYYLGPGVIGRADGLPAFVGADGTKKWYLNGNPGREGGLPNVERPDGVKEWLDARGRVLRTYPAWGAVVTIT
jgi:hypothetical protein